MFICSSILYAFRYRTCQCNQSFQKYSSHPGEGRVIPFLPEITSPCSPKRPPSVSNQGICSIPFSNRGQVTVGFRGCRVHICGPFRWNSIRWLRAKRNSFFEKSLNLSGIVAKTVLDGFRGAVRSNRIPICLETVLLKLEPMSDKQLNPFRRTIRKMPYPLTGKG